jgi:hypothetical protein
MGAKSTQRRLEAEARPAAGAAVMARRIYSYAHVQPRGADPAESSGNLRDFDHVDRFPKFPRQR